MLLLVDRHGIPFSCFAGVSTLVVEGSARIQNEDVEGDNDDECGISLLVVRGVSRLIDIGSDSTASLKADEVVSMASG